MIIFLWSVAELMAMIAAKMICVCIKIRYIQSGKKEFINCSWHGAVNGLVTELYHGTYDKLHGLNGSD